MDTVRGQDEPPRASINAAPSGGRYVVTAEHGVSLDTDELAGYFGSGEIITLEADAARALLGDGSIQEVSE